MIQRERITCSNTDCGDTFTRGRGSTETLCPSCRSEKKNQADRTPEQIAELTAEIRKGWTPKDYQKRSGGADCGVELRPVGFGRE